MQKVEVVDESSKIVKGGGGGSAAVRDALHYSGGSSNGARFKPRQDTPEARGSLRGAWASRSGNAPSKSCNPIPIACFFLCLSKYHPAYPFGYAFCKS